jgi:exodeoxyribonuclease VII large subunit
VTKTTMTDPIFSVSDAVVVLNQTLDYAYPTMTIIGEVSGFNISKNKWLYFDVKDEGSKLKCFGTIYQLKMPLEDGMQISLTVKPRLHNLYGFSLNVVDVRPVGEGSIKKAADLLARKLEKEGLFALERKRPIPYAPTRVGVIASEQSAAFSDFTKIMNARWQGVELELYDSLVQGADAPDSIIAGVQYFNQLSEPPEVLVLIRGGGSADDLSAFSEEPVVRAVSASRVPTIVAIGHEVDTSLAELAADLRASTPSNAAELLFPDKLEAKDTLRYKLNALQEALKARLQSESTALVQAQTQLVHVVERVLTSKAADLQHAKTLLASIHPTATLKRGYAVIESKGMLVSSVSQLKASQLVDITLQDGTKQATIKGE